MDVVTYLPSIVVGLIIISLIARVVLITGLPNVDGRCSATDIVVIMTLTSIITICTAGLCAVGMWCAWHAGSSQAPASTEARHIMGGASTAPHYEQLFSGPDELTLTDRNNGLTQPKPTGRGGMMP